MGSTYYVSNTGLDGLTNLSLMRCKGTINPLGNARKAGNREALGYSTKGFQEEVMPKLVSEVESEWSR